MRITADTNMLVRAVTEDHPVQTRLAQRMLADAEIVALTLPALCEFCWVLDRVYGFDNRSIAKAIRGLIAADNVAVDDQASEAGLLLLEAGGDFADGVIAHSGRWLGAETFVSFDRKAVRLLQQSGEAALIPG